MRAPSTFSSTIIMFMLLWVKFSDSLKIIDTGLFFTEAG